MTTVYAAMRNALVVADRAGAEWADTRSLDGDDLECVDVSPDAPNRAFVGTFGSGLQRSTDGGDSFERVGRETIEQDAVMSVAVSPRDPDVVYAGTEPSRVYRSTDGGETWASLDGLTDLPSADEWSFPPRPDTHHVRWVEPDPNDADRLYVGIEAGALVFTGDGGETWRERPPGSRRDNHTLTTHPDAPDRAWSAAGDGYAETYDGGETWEHPQSGLDHRYCWSVAVAPDDPDTVLMSAASGAYAAHTAGRAESYLYRKRNGDEWFRLSDFPDGEGVLRAVLARGTKAGELVAATNRGLFRTADAGDHWERVPVPWERFDEHTCRGMAVVS
jgi:photosystem II stability/assembly factor-like uncharacterized protein